ncbi:MAG: glycoside hydrolase family 9 protein [Calditrichia bacterium]
MSALLSCISLPLTAQILTNQVGYLPVSGKYIYTTQPTDSFYIIDTGTQAIRYRGQIQVNVVNDPNTESNIFEGDFSALEEPGTYIATLPGQGFSQAFQIGESVFDDAAKASLKAFYFQRCGLDLIGGFADPYFHPRCHSADGFYHPSTGLSGFRLSRGGWHDAGDYGKYVVNASVTVGTLLMAYEVFPARFASDNLNIPESGNGIPDILDEVRYELEWMLQMQDTMSGGVFHKLTFEVFSAFAMPQNTSGTRYIYEKSTAATADFAAVMAKASRLYQGIDASFAQKCLDRAVLAWGYLQTNPSIVPPGGFQNPAGTNTGTYGDGNDSDERFWAATELYITTGEAVYHNFFIANYNQFGLISSEVSWPNVQTLGYLAYMLNTVSGQSQNIKTLLRTSLLNFAEGTVATINARGMRLALSPGEFVWGSNSVVMNRAILMIVAFEEYGTRSYRDAALAQLDYIFGANIHDISFLPGSGTNQVMNLHHRPSAADGIAGSLPGMLSGGPNEFLGDPVLQANFTNATPPARCWIDDVGSYAGNEMAINWNGAIAFVLGYFAGGGTISPVEPESPLPKSMNLKSNYPNPFNPETIIPFELDQATFVRLEIINSLGQVVRTLLAETRIAGEHRVKWDAKTNSGSIAPSGVYFYRLSGDQAVLTHKMLLMR